MNFEFFKKLSKGKKMVPVYFELKGDMDTPITLFKKLCDGPNSYLLESVDEGNRYSKYSYIGRKPFMTIKSYGDHIIINKKDEMTKKTGHVMTALKALMKEYTVEKIEKMPDFIGGAVGYIGYDIVRDYECLSHENINDLNMPDVHLLLTEEVIVYDHVRQKIIIIVNALISGDVEKSYKKAIERIEELTREILNAKVEMDHSDYQQMKSSAYKSNETKETFMEKVLRAKEYIRNGDIFQVVLSQRLELETEVDPLKAYRVLRSMNPSPYMYYIDFGDYQIVGSSPELLVKVTKDIVETCPIAGTRPRGENPEQDHKNVQELLSDEKELAEHLMLVDLARNDIGKISEFKTVVVDKFMEVHKYSHVMHIVSHVIGKVRRGLDLYDGLISCLPAGTVSGAPKIRAMEIIDELENKKRGVYAGALGYIGFDGDINTCITIRTIIFKDKKAYIQAGAGIVADSDPEKEYEETLRKAEALLSTIRKAEVN